MVLNIFYNKKAVAKCPCVYKHAIKLKHKNFKVQKFIARTANFIDIFLKYIENDKQNKQKTLTKEKQRLLLSCTYKLIPNQTNT